ncbi:3-demethylubiquinol 3-O-methyltransferase @ 2-polyprenyl-6-hydroxyphenyl methylase [hydrothermal vent metagenome]|uniref:3-demethylubiquinol 3-O-methyltransferase @ 2-polyprenyl-6-hydroxyphenyl methylase n=1 Tax=hydrothermal vent metagenome TaxID=652676 RepID=A0A3B0TF94_9ZZZZ
MPKPATTVDPAEVERFSALAREWWDPKGKFHTLHKFNPVRLGYIRDGAARAYDRDARSLKPLEGLSLLDIGCGGGLLSEPLCRMGAHVTAIDPSEKNIGTALAHATQNGLDIDYRATTAEALAQTGAAFDIVLNMEVVEHVADVELFLKTAAGLTKPGGLMFVATLNRTLKAFALAIVGAEYVLRWLPRGTHTWEKFVTPEEIKSALKPAGLTVIDETGITFNPLTDRWSLATDMDVNYMMTAQKAD